MSGVTRMAKKERDDLVSEVLRVGDLANEAMLASTILHYARGGHATALMVEQAIVIIDKHIAYAAEKNDKSWLDASISLKARLEQALIDGIKTLRIERGPGPELLQVEEPLARVRIELGHKIRRQHRCAGGIIDIYDLTTDELIECKAVGNSASLADAASQLQRYRQSFPGASLTIAVVSIEANALWLAEVLRQQGIDIIEMEGRERT